MTDDLEIRKLEDKRRMKIWIDWIKSGEPLFKYLKIK